jgi:hypothetical protein
MLRWLLCYPALDRGTFIDIATREAGGVSKGNRAGSQGHQFNQRVLALRKLGLAAEIKQFAGHYALTQEGMRFFSLLNGIGSDVMSGSWGHPEKIGKFAFQQAHQTRVLGIIRKIAREGILLHAGTESNRLVFYDIEFVSERIPKIEIRPDVIISVQVNETARQSFWIEVDRGTRKGEKIRWKLEKMFKIFYAHKNPFGIEPVLYMIDCGDIHNESRVRYILNLLKNLSSYYPRVPLQVMVTSADLFDHVRGTFLTQPIWRMFYLGRVEKTPQSLAEIFLQGRLTQAVPSQ